MQVLVVKKRGELDQLDDDGELGRRSIWKMLAQILPICGLKKYITS